MARSNNNNNNYYYYHYYRYYYMFLTIILQMINIGVQGEVVTTVIGKIYQASYPLTALTPMEIADNCFWYSGLQDCTIHKSYTEGGLLEGTGYNLWQSPAQNEGECLNCCSNSRETFLIDEIWKISCPMSKVGMVYINYFGYEFRILRRRTLDDMGIIRCPLKRSNCEYDNNDYPIGKCEGKLEEGGYISYITDLTIELEMYEKYSGFDSWRNVEHCNVIVTEGERPKEDFFDYKIHMYSRPSAEIPVISNWWNYIYLVPCVILAISLLVRWVRNAKCKICGYHLIYYKEICVICTIVEPEFDIDDAVLNILEERDYHLRADPDYHFSANPTYKKLTKYWKELLDKIKEESVILKKMKEVKTKTKERVAELKFRFWKEKIEPIQNVYNSCRTVLKDGIYFVYKSIWIFVTTGKLLHENDRTEDTSSSEDDKNEGNDDSSGIPLSSVWNVKREEIRENNYLPCIRNAGSEEENLIHDVIEIYHPQEGYWQVARVFDIEILHPHRVSRCVKNYVPLKKFIHLSRVDCLIKESEPLLPGINHRLIFDESGNLKGPTRWTNPKKLIKATISYLKQQGKENNNSNNDDRGDDHLHDNDDGDIFIEEETFDKRKNLVIENEYTYIRNPDDHTDTKFEQKQWCNFYLRHIIEYKYKSKTNSKKWIRKYAKYIFLVDHFSYGLLWDMENKCVLLWRFSSDSDSSVWPPKENENAFIASEAGKDLAAMLTNQHRMYYIGHNKNLQPDRKIDFDRYKKSNKFKTKTFLPDVPNFISRRHQKIASSSSSSKLLLPVAKKTQIVPVPVSEPIVKDHNNNTHHQQQQQQQQQQSNKIILPQIKK